VGAVPLALTLRLPAPEHTTRLGHWLGECVEGGTVLRLVGPLGAGKTHLVQGLAAGLGIPDEAGVRSPSFALVRVHDEGRLPLVHVDLYRLGDSDELLDLGLEEWFGSAAVIAVEWPELADGLLPEGGIAVHIDYDEDAGRVIELHGPEALERRLAASLGDIAAG
jgi:tRNA threonylcarbamoyladenosine biosynthesis protein TsaE